MMVLAFQLYIGFVLLQGAFMKSIQNTTDHDIAIASLKSAVDRLEERIENMTVIQTQGKVFIIRGGGDNWGDHAIRS
jgi:PHP family Zn ribbon phosphoesterase